MKHLSLGKIMNLGEVEKELEGIYLIKGVELTSNIYLIYDELMIDTGNGEPVNRIAPTLMGAGKDVKSVKRVVLTHSHFDHVGGVREIIYAANPEIMAHPLEHPEIKALTSTNMKLTPIVDGDSIYIDDYSFKVLHTPGHTLGSICLYEEKKSLLVSGDTIFPYGGIGRTDLPTGNHNALIISIRKIARLKIRHLLPGHEDPVLKDAATHITYSLKNAESLKELL